MEGFLEIFPERKFEKQNESGAKFTDKSTKLMKKLEQDLIESLQYVLKKQGVGP